MNSSLDLLKRLVSAFEALSLEEQMLLNHRQYDEVAELQAREIPLASRIAELVVQPALRKRMDGELLHRIRQILATLQSKVVQLDQAMSEARLALAQLDHTAARARAVRPAYGFTLPRAAQGAFSAEG